MPRALSAAARGGDFGAQLAGQGVAVNELGGHGRVSQVKTPAGLEQRA
jgi:hypothetical protein